MVSARGAHVRFHRDPARRMGGRGARRRPRALHRPAPPRGRARAPARAPAPARARAHRAALRARRARRAGARIRNLFERHERADGSVLDHCVSGSHWGRSIVARFFRSNDGARTGTLIELTLTQPLRPFVGRLVGRLLRRRLEAGLREFAAELKRDMERGYKTERKLRVAWPPSTYAQGSCARRRAGRRARRPRARGDSGGRSPVQRAAHEAGQRLRVGQHRAEEQHLVAAGEQEGGEVLDVEVADQVGLVLDVDPHEAQRRRRVADGAGRRARRPGCRDRRRRCGTTARTGRPPAGVRRTGSAKCAHRAEVCLQKRKRERDACPAPSTRRGPSTPASRHAPLRWRRASVRRAGRALQRSKRHVLARWLTCWAAA